MRAVVAQVEAHVHPVEKVALFVGQTRRKAFCRAVLLPEDNLHQIGVLHVRRLMVEVHTQHQSVGPRFVHHARLHDDGFIVVVVVEAAIPSVLRVESVGF